MSKCIIIGNGSTLLNTKNGEKIDMFDTVVRFNSYDIDHFKEYVGTKTDIWFNVINFANKINQWRMYKPYRYIYLHSWDWNPTTDKLYIEFINFYKNIPIVIYKTNRLIIKEMMEYIENPYYEYYSTGAIAIWLMLKQFDHVTITGFDWWSNTKHHYNDNAVRGTLHNPLIEKTLIDKLISKNIISIL